MTTTPKPDASQPDAATVVSEQCTLAVTLLQDERARPFLEAVRAKLLETVRPSPAGSLSAADVVALFSTAPDPAIEIGDWTRKLFLVVRWALQRTVRSPDSSVQKYTEQAAAALYCIAACRLVSQEAHRQHAAGGGSRWVVPVAATDRLVCAVIANALFGGELHLQPDPDPRNDLPVGARVFWVEQHVGGERSVDFERAVFKAVMKNDEHLPGLALDEGPLTKQERAFLAERLRTHRDFERHTVALVVRSGADADTPRPFAEREGVPVLIPSSEVTTEILGMDADGLRAAIYEFWRGLEVLRGHESPAPVLPAPRGASAPSIDRANGGVSVHVTGGRVSFAIGPGSSVTNREGASLGEIRALLAELAQAIQQLPAQRNRDALQAQAQILEAEVVEIDKPPSPERRATIRKALEAIKLVGDAIEGGGRIVGVYNSLAQTLGPIIGPMIGS